MKPKLIIFDWDGTLADTTGPIIRTFRQTFADCGLTPPDAETIRPLIGYNLVTIIHRLLPDAGQHLKEQLAETYAHHYLNPNNHNMRLFDSALPCLHTLKEQGYWLAVATGKGRIGLDKAIAQTDTADFWLATTCASEQPYQQPAYTGLCDRPTPVAAQLAQQVMSLPMSADLSFQQQDAVMHALRAALA